MSARFHFVPKATVGNQNASRRFVPDSARYQSRDLTDL